MGELEDYIRVGETWRTVDSKNCPECGGIVTANSRIHVCSGEDIADDMRMVGRSMNDNRLSRTLKRCPNCGRLYNSFVNDRCPWCRGKR